MALPIDWSTGLVNSAYTTPVPIAPLPPSPLPITANAFGSGFVSSTTTGATIGTGILPGIGTVIGAGVGLLAGALGSIFGGSPDTPTQQDQLIGSLRSFFPDQNAPMCGSPFDLSSLNGGSPLWANLPCSDPGVGALTRAGAEWYIKTYGIGQFLQMIISFLSQSPTGQALTGGAVTATSPTAGLDTGLTNVTSVLSEVATAVAGALGAQTASASANQTAAIGAIQNTLGTFTQGLTTFQSSIGSTIGSAIASALSDIFNAGGGVSGAIVGAIEALGREQGSLLGTILNTIDGNLATLENSLLGIPISIGAILKSIFQNLPQILVELGGAIGGPLAKIVHAIEVLTGRFPGNAKSTIDWSDFGDILARVMKAGEDIAGVATSDVKVVYQPHDVLGPGCTLEQAVEALDKASGRGVEFPKWISDAIGMVGAALVHMIRLIPLGEQFEKLAAEEQNKACPIEKLPPSDVIEAVRRGIVQHDQATQELLLQGISTDRIKILSDLATYLENPQTAIDWWWRNIVSDETLTTLLQQNGFTAEQIDATKKASFAITSMEVANEGFQRGYITDAAWADIATANRLDSVQVDLLRLLRERPPGPTEALRGQLTRDGLGNISIPGFTDFDTVPDYLTTACHSAGLNDDTALRIWWSHYNFGSIGDWITSYFRGRRLYPELASVANALGVPETFLSDFVANSRPLIPFRTIPAMIKGGIITEARGKELLAHHGFDDQSITDLLKYATVGSKSSKSATAQSQHDVSLSTARTAYDDGILTQDQYMELLKAHGLDDNAAATEVQVANISQEVKARKQIVTDVVNEYNAGLLDQQAAIQQLATSGLSVAEQAGAVRKMKSAQSTKAKQPSEADLRAWAKATIISADEYQSRLVKIGWLPSDAQNFRDQHFPAA